MKYNVLVTGGLGFVGSQLIKTLIRENNIGQIVSIDNMSNGLVKNYNEDVVNIIDDVGNKEILEDALKRYEINQIIHLAGQSSGQISFEKPLLDAKSNIYATLNVLDLARKYKINRIILASSMSVYGDSDIYVDENTKTSPKSIYGVNKLAIEHYGQIYANEYGLNVTSLRFFNIYGPGQNLDNSKQGMISIYLKMALLNKHIIVKGSLKRFRDFIYIDDVITAIINTIGSKKLNGYNCLNICTGKKIEIAEVINHFKNIDSNITYEVKSSTPGDQSGIYGNPTKAVELGLLKIKTGLYDGLLKTYHYENENLDSTN